MLTAFAELSLRFFLGLGTPLLYATDVHFGYMPAPNQSIRRFGANIRINMYGMRSDPVPAARESDSIRLLFIGDSVTFGTTYVDQSEIFTELIKSALAARFKVPVEVLNASAGGWAPENEYEFLATRGTFDADVVVLVCNTNDLDQPFAPYEEAPQFPTHRPLSALWELWTRYVQPRIMARVPSGDPGSLPEAVPNAALEANVFATLERAREIVQSRGARFAILFSPADYANQAAPAWVAAVQRLHDWAQRSGVPLIDMTSPYRHYSHEQIYLDDIHLRPFAHNLVAKAFVAAYPLAIADGAARQSPR